MQLRNVLTLQHYSLLRSVSVFWHASMALYYIHFGGHLALFAMPYVSVKALVCLVSLRTCISTTRRRRAPYAQLAMHFSLVGVHVCVLRQPATGLFCQSQM
jgi:hypothetical protein